MGEDTTGLSNLQAADRAIDAVIRQAKDVGIPENFSSVKPYPKMRMGTGWYANRPKEIRSEEAEIEKMAEHLMNDVCTPGQPPRGDYGGCTPDTARLHLREDGPQCAYHLPGGC